MDESRSSELKRISLKRDDICEECLVALPAGGEAYWSRADRKVTCLGCAGGPPPPRRAAGSSAQLEYERRRQNRIARGRNRLGKVGGWAAELSQGPQHERAWARGAAGERRNAQRLERLVKGHPVSFLHDRRMPGSRANIDHIAIGRSGVVVIDSKNVQGTVKVDWEGGLLSARRWYLYIGGRDRTAWVESVERQVEAIAAALGAAGHHGVSVGGALCMANGEGLPWIGYPQLRGIAICRPRHVAKRLTAKGSLTESDISAITRALENAFAPA